MRALYLPSLVRTLLYNPIEAFEAIEPAFYEHYLTFVSMQIKSAAGYRLIREHPTEATEFRAKVLDHIINWSGEIKPVSIVSPFAAPFATDDLLSTSGLTSLYQGVGRDWTVDAMSALVHLYDQITFVALATRDNSPQGRSDPLYVTPRMRDELSVRVPALHELGTRVRDQDRESYPLSLDMIRATLLPDLYSLRRGDVLVAELVENGRYDYWWACEVKQPAGRKLEPVAQCDEGTSDELRACGRVSHATSSFTYAEI